MTDTWRQLLTMLPRGVRQLWCRRVRVVSRSGLPDLRAASACSRSHHHDDLKRQPVGTASIPPFTPQIGPTRAPSPSTSSSGERELRRLELEIKKLENDTGRRQDRAAGYQWEPSSLASQCKRHPGLNVCLEHKDRRFIGARHR
jgi:hypothetical protein